MSKNFDCWDFIAPSPPRGLLVSTPFSNITLYTVNLVNYYTVCKYMCVLLIQNRGEGLESFVAVALIDAILNLVD